MKQIHVMHRQQQWVAESGNEILFAAATKDEAVGLTVELARSLGEPVSVRIHKLDGELQEERTYPRNADSPRASG
jgi:Uncharacterized protein conserved in bacteria (DUF2188)